MPDPESGSFEVFIGTTPGENAPIGSKPIAEPQAFELVFANLRALGIEGATLWSGYGYWRGEVERFIVVYLGAISAEDMRRFVLMCRQAFNQDSIGWRRASPIVLEWKGSSFTDEF